MHGNACTQSVALFVCWFDKPTITKALFTTSPYRVCPIYPTVVMSSGRPRQRRRRRINETTIHRLARDNRDDIVRETRRRCDFDGVFFLRTLNQLTLRVIFFFSNPFKLNDSIEVAYDYDRAPNRRKILWLRKFYEANERRGGASRKAVRSVIPREFKQRTNFRRTADETFGR